VGRPCSCVVYSCPFFLHCRCGRVRRDFAWHSALLVQVDFRFSGRTAYVRCGTRSSCVKTSTTWTQTRFGLSRLLANRHNHLVPAARLCGTSFPSLSAFQHPIQHFQHCPGALVTLVSSHPSPPPLVTTLPELRPNTRNQPALAPTHPTPHKEKRIVRPNSWTVKCAVCFDELCTKAQPRRRKGTSPYWPYVPCI
jgi:hypothetical protein